MSIHIVNLRKLIVDPAVDRVLNMSLRDFDKGKMSESWLRSFVGATLLALRDLVEAKRATFGPDDDEFLKAQLQVVPSDAINPAQDLAVELDLGRIKLHRLTSPFALATYPRASHELFITMYGDDNSVHIFLVYL